MIDISEIKKLASLSKLSFSDDEIQVFAKDFDTILSFADMICEFDTKNADAAAHASEQFNILREDEPMDSLPREMALKNAPMKNGESFIVPKIVE